MTKTDTFRTVVEVDQPTHAEAPHPSEADLSSDDAAVATAIDCATALVSGRQAELHRRLQAGDRNALEEVLRAARPRLTAVALKIVRNPDDAQDVVQDAMLKVWRYVGRFEGRAALSTWLHRIVVNTAVDHLRSRRAGPVTLHNGPEATDEEERRVPEAVSAETPEELLARAEVGAVVRRGIARLSLVHREVLALRELEGESYQAIAQLARCPVGTVMSRLHHARQRLAEDLAQDAAPLMQQAA